MRGLAWDRGAIKGSVLRSLKKALISCVRADVKRSDKGERYRGGYPLVTETAVACQTLVDTSS